MSAKAGVRALALLVALVTGAGAASLGGTGTHARAAVVYVILAAAALVQPRWIVLQVIGGQLLAAALLLAPGGPDPLWLLPLMVGVTLGAELLGAAARQDSPRGRSPLPELRRAGLSAVVGGGAFGAVLMLGTLPGPPGLLAIALAVGASVAVAAVLVR